MDSEHSIKCGECGESYGGPDEPYECPNIVYAEVEPGRAERRHREWGECYCHAYDDSECACGGLWEQRQSDEAWANLADNIRIAAVLCASYEMGCLVTRSDHTRLMRRPTATWRPGCNHAYPVDTQWTRS